MSREKIFYLIVVAVMLVLLAGHISQYYFLTDDAFISFRYADNLASGKGLVFNEGERVEGYTNFLWVIILFLFRLIGWPPEVTANILSMALSAVLFGSVVYFGHRIFAVRRFDFFTLIAPLLVVLNRTYAVWSTGGLETKLFSFLIFPAVILLVPFGEGGRPRYRLSALFFTLAALTRPEGILLFGCFFGVRLLLDIRQKGHVKAILGASSIFVFIIGAHFVFRLLYYGYPFPNTFYAKVVDGWFEIGIRYLFQFVHEYGLYPGLLSLVFIFGRHYELRKRLILVFFLVPFVPYLVYLAYIGGDHFEFRPLDVMVPFLALAFQEGLRAFYRLADGCRSRLPAVGWTLYVVVLIFFYVVPGWLSHRNFPREYGSATAIRTSERSGSVLSGWPGLAGYLGYLDRLHAVLAGNFAGIRQEEHRLAMEEVFAPQAHLMERALARGLLVPDDKISLWCVGIIPYRTGLETIDFLGLTDSHIAHRKRPEIPAKLLPSDRLLAHQRRPEWNYLVRRRVTFISTVPAKFFFPWSEFFDGDRLKYDRLNDRTFLVPFDSHVFVFRSVWRPDYFEEVFARRGYDFLYKETGDSVFYFPAESEE